MDPNVIKKVNFTLSAENIISFDLLMALGKKDLVPDDIEKEKIKKVIARDGVESAEGYIKSAIQDLQKQQFNNKDNIITLLKKQLHGTRLGSFDFAGILDSYSPLAIIACVGLIVIPVYFSCCRKKPLLLVSRNSRRKRRNKK